MKNLVPSEECPRVLEPIFGEILGDAVLRDTPWILFFKYVFVVLERSWKGSPKIVSPMRGHQEGIDDTSPSTVPGKKDVVLDVEIFTQVKVHNDADIFLGSTEGDVRQLPSQNHVSIDVKVPLVVLAGLIDLKSFIIYGKIRKPPFMDEVEISADSLSVGLDGGNSNCAKFRGVIFCRQHMNAFRSSGAHRQYGSRSRSQLTSRKE